jgi:hypothetical protein
MAGGCRSGSPGPACLQGMHVTCVVITIVAALANGYAAVLNFAGAESVKVVADRVQVSRRRMIPFGILLAAGALGLLTGFAVPVLGTAAAISLVRYFIGALSAHLRVRDPRDRRGGQLPGAGRGRPDRRPWLPQPVVMPPCSASRASGPVTASGPKGRLHAGQVR